MKFALVLLAWNGLRFTRTCVDAVLGRSGAHEVGLFLHDQGIRSHDLVVAGRLVEGLARVVECG